MAVMGEYVEKANRENIKLRLSRGDIMSVWKRCGMTADYSAEYISTYFDGAAKLGNSASTVLNELIENAAKYSCDNEDEIEIDVSIDNETVYFQVNNCVEPERFYIFRDFVQEILESNDINALYFNRLSTLDDGDQDKSGIGLLSIISFFNLKFGFKFKSLDSNKSFLVSVQAAMPVGR